MEHFLKFPQSILTANLVHMAFSANSMSSKHPQNHIVPQVQGGFLSGHNFQDFDFWGAEDFLRVFLPFVLLGSARGLPRAAAPEAKHLFSSQLAAATIPWSSGSSRRRRPWMHRAIGAVASEEDIGGETSWGMRLLWSVWRCWWFKCFVDFVYHFFWKVCQCAKTFAPTFSVVLCDHYGVVAYTSICCLEIGWNKYF